MTGMVEFWRDGTPSGDHVYFYPGAARGGIDMDGPLLRVTTSDDRHWYATCRSGSTNANGLFQFARDPSRFVVVQSGCGYCIAYDDPTVWEQLPLSGFARFAIFAPEADILMLFDWIQGVGYGPAGRVWTTPRLFLDDLEVVQHDDDRITLRGRELEDEATIVLSVRDGSILSGRPSRFN